MWVWIDPALLNKPDHEPEAVQLVVFVEDHDCVKVWSWYTVLGDSVTRAVGSALAVSSTDCCRVAKALLQDTV